MDEASASDEWHTVAELAHKMLPPARHIGASELTRCLVKIEDSIKNNGDRVSTKALTKETFTEFEAIRKF